MLYIPLIYFILLDVYFLYVHRKWNMDVAATSILVVISISAILLDMNDLYGDYGINDYSITFPTILLFCFQWTMVLIPIHWLSTIKFEKPTNIKESLLKFILLVITVNAIIMIFVKLPDIKEALIMDLADVRNQHYEELNEGGGGTGMNLLMLIPSIIVSPPFPTLALFFWFYLNSFTKSSFLLKTGVLFASVLSSCIAIIMAGRAALVYWVFDFYIIYSYFYQYLPKKVKVRINLSAATILILITILFTAITIARFDVEKEGGTPMASLYGYAGQHVNNFCVMFEEGERSPLQIGRIFPLTAKLIGQKFDLKDHYDTIASHVKPLVNVFDTFGAEIYLDLGWFGYFTFFLLLWIFTFYIKHNWKTMKFYRVFALIIVISFFTRGLFAWPFTGHYSSFALITMLIFTVLFKYRFKFK